MAERAAETHVWLVWCKCSAVERRLCRIGLDHHQALGIVYLANAISTPAMETSFVADVEIFWAHPRALVLAAGDEVCPVLAELQIGDGVAMRALVVVDLLARLHVELRDLARLVSSDDHVGDVGEGADGRLRTDRVEHMEGLF